MKFSSGTASGALTFKLHLSGQSYLCLFFIYIFTQFKVVSSLECLLLTQALPSNLSVLPKSIPRLISLVWVCMCASMHTHTRTHTHTHTHTRSHWDCKSLFISCLITNQGNMQSLRTASGHLPIMHDLLLWRVLYFLHNLQRETFAKSTLFRIITVGITVMGKQSHTTDSTETGTSDSSCDKLIFQRWVEIKFMTHSFTQGCLIYSFYPLLTCPPPWAIQICIFPCA